MQNNSPDIAPEEEILEGVIVDDGDPNERESTIEDADEIKRVVESARSYNPNSLEETTKNIENLKGLLGRFL